MGGETNVYETISRRLFAYARWNLTTVRDDDALAEIYWRSERDAGTREDIEALGREAAALAIKSRGSIARPARSEAAALVSLCLEIRREQNDPSEANLYIGAFANTFCIARAAKEGRLHCYNANSRDGREQMLSVITSAAGWCPEYGDIETGHVARLTELIQKGESAT